MHKTKLERHSFLGAITWSEIGKQKRQAKVVYYPYTLLLGLGNDALVGGATKNLVPSLSLTKLNRTVF